MKSQNNKIWNQMYLKNMMVRSLDKRWNLFYPSLLILYKKLERLFEENNGLVSLSKIELLHVVV